MKTIDENDGTSIYKVKILIAEIIKVFSKNVH